MRSQPAAISTALSTATQDGVNVREAVFIEARNRSTGAVEEIGLWQGDEDLTLSVIRGRDGVTVNRAYYSAAALQVGEIVRTAQLTVQTLRIDLSQLADAVTLAVRTHDVARAPIEVHEIFLSPETGRPIAADLPVFAGIVDEASIRTPRIGGKGKVELVCVSEMAALLDRGNPEKASYETQKLRDGDEWALYAGVVETWEISWGQR